MNLHDLAPGFDDPVEALLGFHRRIERNLATLGKLPAQLEVRGNDAEASANAAAVIDFFSSSIAIHHADEEELMPLLVLRAPSSIERENLNDLRNRLEGEHRGMERTWRALRRPLEGIAEGVQRRLPDDLVQYFRASHAMHISIEEARLHVSAANLFPADRASIARGMMARRTRRLRAG
jgi:pyridoxamine 5'-phosphate oxidase